MKNRTLIAALALAGSLAGSALPQDPAPSTALARIQSTFRAADADKDGSISAREAGRAGIPSRDFAAHDTDRDRKLSETEFLLYYRFLLVKAQRPVDKDVEAEVARIQAARRAREAEEAKKKQEAAPKVVKPVITAPVRSPEQPSRPTAAAGTDDEPKNESAVAPAQPRGAAPAQGRLGTSERLRRARASLSGTNRAADAGADPTAAERASAMRLKQRSAEMRAKLAQQEEQRRKAAARVTPDPSAAIGTDGTNARTDAAELERRAEAMRLKKRSEEMRAKLAQEQAGAQGKPAPEVSSEELARRAEAMRLKKRSEEMRAKLAKDGKPQGKDTDPKGADPESAGTRAQRYASRFVDAGLMSAAEGRELSEALGSGRIAALEPAQRSHLLSSLRKAHGLVDNKLAKGKIDRKEAASLRQLLDGHTKALNPELDGREAGKPEPEAGKPEAGKPEAGKPGVREAPKKAPRPDVERPEPTGRDKDRKGKKGGERTGRG